MTQLHAREMPAPKRDRHGNLIEEVPAAAEPVVEEKVEEKPKPKAKKKAAAKKKPAAKKKAAPKKKAAKKKSAAKKG